MSIPTILFYGVLLILTAYLVSKATSLKGKSLENTTVYEVTDRASWILGGLLLGLLPIWWKWPIHSIFGAIIVPILGVTITGGLAQLFLGTILSAQSIPELIRKLLAFVIALLVLYFIGNFIWNFIT